MSATRYKRLQWEDMLNREIGRLDPRHNYNPSGSVVRAAVKNLRDRDTLDPKGSPPREKSTTDPSQKP